ncbi:hypothetical protein DL766_006994 [Monosporascus sp. MC13-8B]|uniref:DUF7136 domain-containing protein n=1 Tax=Monosporascus cannonballus TaxID=155416 RepID=A0ABY0HAS9_9PEZI|nr:hypothetical protein DL763_008049 [Monosporascus cannonballus]RYO87051.1 hypothetical protein DL762_004476 [Monosporascus cannonballus]RYP25598.1 hypothetical protein DL766_006994 [Monosporascus sp. MC13-8B]
MLLRLLLPSLLALSLAVLAQAERRLPADLQVDLLFPRNETYAPTQWFPIVLGIQNSDALWPFDISLGLAVLSLDAWQNSSSRARAEWQHVDLRLNSVSFPEAVGPAPDKHFLYYPTINMTNGTTDSITPGGQTPDVAATVDACPEAGENTTTVVRVTEVRKTRDTGDQCPVFETDMQPARCAYRDVAQELAANVSAAILDRMGCEEGTWQNITAPCVPRESGTASSTGLQRDLASWALVLGLALAAYYHVF